MTIEQMLAPETDAQFLKRVTQVVLKRTELLHAMSEQGEELIRLHSSEACADNPESIEAAREELNRLIGVWNRADVETVDCETVRIVEIARHGADDGTPETRLAAKALAYAFGVAADRFSHCGKTLQIAGL